MQLCGSRWGLVLRFCEHGDEHSVSMKAEKLLTICATISF
jgi:hypothetical protein